jgi:predicted RNA-binding Zn-ribbon protein involved in translation (DUF1610 family)
MMTAFYIFGGLFLCIGAVFFIRGMRGKVVNDHPHCRGCGFDLIGIELSSPINCPECGRLVSASKASVRHGLRKRRKKPIVCGVLLLMLGTVGVSWLKISKIPAIQQINWYEHLPETMLISMAGNGSDKALEVLHERLVPGELSDDGLGRLAEQGLAMMKDESPVAWDTRWGDVLFCALLNDGMSSGQRAQYIESLYTHALYIHPQVEADQETVHSNFVMYRLEKGCASYDLYDLIRLGSPVLQAQLEGLKFAWTIDHQTESDQGPVHLSSYSSGGNSGWAPIGNGGLNSQAVFKPAENQHDFAVLSTLSAKITLYDRVIHEWEIPAEAHVTRVEHPVGYAQRLEQEQVIEDYVSSLRMGSVVIPWNTDEAVRLPGLEHFRVAIRRIQSPQLNGIGLVGQVSFLDGEKEIPCGGIALVPKFDTRIPGLNTFSFLNWAYNESRVGDVEYGLDELQRDRAFWAVARMRGAVDVVFRPSPEYLYQFPRIETYLDRPVIFRDVRVEYAQPYDSPDSERWGWSMPGGLDLPHEGELFNEGDN